MINVSQTFKDGVKSQSRKVSVKAIIDITPLNVTYSGVTGSTQSAYSKSAQVYDEIPEMGLHAISHERNRWLFSDSGRTFRSYDYSGMPSQQVGYESRDVFNAAGNGNYYVEMSFQNVSILQACHIYFPDNDIDGFPVNFTVQVKQGNTVAYTATFTNNRLPDVFVAGFTVYWPTAIRVTVTKWSLPFRRMRVPEIWLGMHDEWLDDMFASFNIQQKASFTAFGLPYTTCSMNIDNSDKRFDPTNKESMFLSLEERQPIEVYFSINDSEYYVIGTYYHYSGGWKTGNSQLTLQWNLVDLLGLLVDRQFNTYPYRGTNAQSLPTTLEGWVRALLLQLGETYADMYEIPNSYRNTSIVLTNTTSGRDVWGNDIIEAVDRIEGKTCGEILQWICQATQTWPRALPNGRLYVGGFERYGQASLDNTFKYDYDNLEQYPTIQANDDIARMDYHINSSSFPISGNSQSSPNTQAIDNPFISTQAAALTSAQYILQFYGGNLFKLNGRGNPAQEVGDLVYVEIAHGAFSAGRVVEQSFQISDHVMKSCQTTVMGIRPTVEFNSFVVITEDTTWTVPGNVVLTDGYAQLKMVLVQSGATGGHGQWGSPTEIHTWDGGYYPEGIPGDPGYSGHGGRVNDVQVNGDYVHVNRGQAIQVHIGRALPPETKPIRSEFFESNLGPFSYYMYNDNTEIEGGHTTVTINGTVFTSADGRPAVYTNYETEFVEPISQKSVSKSAQRYPRPNSGDGGAGGEGGEGGYGTPTYGTKGADGCVIFCYSIEGAT